jgi:hypothetical protein
MIIKLNSTELVEFVELRGKSETLKNKIVDLKLELDTVIANLKFVERMQDNWMVRLSADRKLEPDVLLNAKFDTARGIVILPDHSE